MSTTREDTLLLPALNNLTETLSAISALSGHRIMNGIGKRSDYSDNLSSHDIPDVFCTCEQPESFERCEEAADISIKNSSLVEVTGLIAKAIESASDGCTRLSRQQNKLKDRGLGYVYLR